MPKLSDSEIESVITQSHANLLALSTAQVDAKTADRAMVRELRTVFSLGQDNGKAIVLEKAEQLIAPSLVSAQGVQLIVSTEALIHWCDEANHEMEVRSYSVRRTVFTDAEKAWCATAHALDKSTAVFGASHAEALARLATWCRDQARDTDRPREIPTEPNNERPEQTAGES